MNKNSMFRRLTALLITLVMLVGVLPLTAHATDVSLEYDSGDDEYYVNMSKTDHYDLDFSGGMSVNTFKVYDGGGKSEKYTASNDSYLTITAPSGYVITVSGTIDLESNPAWDYMIFYDGYDNNADVLGPGVSSSYPGRYAGNDYSLDTLITTGTSLTIYFHSDSSVQNNGFDLTVSLVNAATTCTVTYENETESKSYTVDMSAPYTVKKFTSMFTLPYRMMFSHWEDANSTEYSEGEQITLTGDLTLTAVIEPMPAIIDGVNGFYSVMPVTDTITVDITDKSAGFSMKIYDDGGAEGNHSDNCNGFITILAPDGLIIAVSGHGKLESERYDYLLFYDGADSTANLLGEGTNTNYPNHYGGSNFTFGEIYTSGNALTVNFITDSNGVHEGFELEIKLYDMSSAVAVTYADGANSYTHYETINSLYTVKTYASMFTAAERTMFTHWVDENNVEYDEGDQITLLENITLTAVIEPMPVIIDGGAAGFYTIMAKSTPLTADLTGESAGYTLKVYDDGGPSGDYSNSCTGYLTVLAPDGLAITVSGGGTTESMSYDYLMFYDGEDLNADVLGEGSPTSTHQYTHRYGGSNFTVDTLMATGNALTIRFISDTSTVKSGFELTVKLIDKATVTYEYNGVAIEDIADKSSPYTVGTFSSMFTLPYRQLLSHWVDANDVIYNENDQITLTGDLTLTAVLMPMPAVVDGGAEGFYSVMPVAEEITADLTGKSAGFTMKVYDDGGKNGNYSNNCSGILHIVAPSDTVLSISGSGVTNSANDRMFIYNGEINNYDFKTYSGNFTVQQYNSVCSEITIKFVSDSSVSANGFELNITLIDASDYLTVTFDAGSGSGTMNSISVPAGTNIVLPECAFDTPSDIYGFNYYICGETRYDPGDTLTVNSDMTLTALYDLIYTVRFSDGSASYEWYVVNGHTVTLPGLAPFALPYRNTFNGWKLGDTIYQTGYVYTATDSVTFTADLTQLPYMQSDDGGDFLDLPQFDDLTLDLTNKPDGYTFHVYDSGSYLNAYSSNSSGSMTFTAPDGYVFEVSGILSSEQDSDVLTITDPASNDNFEFSGTNVTIHEIYTSSNTLKIGFESDRSITAAGFDLTVTLHDTSNQITITVEPGNGTGTAYTLTRFAGAEFMMPECEFTTPSGMIFTGYSDGTNVYDEYDYVTFYADTTLTATYAKGCLLVYEDKMNSLTDYWYYAQGTTITLPGYDTLADLPLGFEFWGWRHSATGTMYSAGDTFTVTGNVTLYAVIHALPILVDDGAGGWYVNMAKNTTLTVDLYDKPLGFSFNIYDDGGESGDYTGNNTNTYMRVIAPEGYALAVEGYGVIEDSYDYLGLYNGKDSSYDFTSYDADFNFEDYTTDGRYLFIKFESDYITEYDGFCLTVTVIEVPRYYDVTYTYNGHSSTSSGIKEKTVITLENFDYLFTLPDGYGFAGWSDGTYIYNEGDDYRVTGDVILDAIVLPYVNVTYDGGIDGELNDGSGGTQITPDTVLAGENIILPYGYDYFYAPANKYFAGWELNSNEYYPEHQFTVNENVTFTALWRDESAWDELVDTACLLNPGEDYTVVLNENLVIPAVAEQLVIYEDTTLTIDLNGFTIDGSNYSISDVIIITYGTLIFTDTSANSDGCVTGGNIRVIVEDGGSVTFTETMQNHYTVTEKRGYTIENLQTYDEVSGVYSVKYCENLYSALLSAALPNDFTGSDVHNPFTSSNAFIPSKPCVTLLSDEELPQNETWEVNSEHDIYIDLNGHEWSIAGELTGGISYTSPSSSGNPPATWFEETEIYVNSTVPGVLRCSGDIGVNMRLRTADTVYVTGGAVTGYFEAKAGTFYISGGTFTGGVRFINDSQTDDLNVYVSGNTEIKGISVKVNDSSSFGEMYMTVTGNARISDFDFNVWELGSGTKPNVVLSGGYYDVNPRSWIAGFVAVSASQADPNNMDQYYAPIGTTLVPYADLTAAQISACTEFYYVSADRWAGYIKFAEEPEKYIAQTNWAADSNEYGWRITEATALRFERVSLTLQNNIKINFLVNKELVNNSGYENLYAVFEMDGTNSTVSECTDNGTYYIFSFKNISPDKMNDTIRATLYGTRGDKQYVCIRMNYSIAEYCYTVLSDSTQAAKLRTLLVDLLHYGAASQVYTGHNTANLVDADLTATQLSWGTADPIDLTSVTNSPNGQLTDPEVRWKAVSLRLGNSITMQFVFSAADTTGLTIKIEDSAVNGNVLKEYTASSFTPSGSYYRINFSELTAGQMSDTVYVTAYRGDTAVSGTLTYSVESYAYAKKNDADANLASLVIAMMKYGRSAYAFSHN